MVGVVSSYCGPRLLGIVTASLSGSWRDHFSLCWIVPVHRKTFIPSPSLSVNASSALQLMSQPKKRPHPGTSSNATYEEVLALQKNICYSPIVGCWLIDLSIINTSTFYKVSFLFWFLTFLFLLWTVLKAKKSRVNRQKEYTKLTSVYLMSNFATF